MSKFGRTDIASLNGDSFGFDGPSGLGCLPDPGGIAALAAFTSNALASSSVTTSGSTTSATSADFEWSGTTFSSIEGYYYPPDNGFAANAGAAGSEIAIAAENGAIQTTRF